MSLQTFVNEKMVCWFDCWSPALVLLLFPFISFAKLNFDMFMYLCPVLATKSKPLWNDGDFGMLTLSFCSVFSSFGAVDANFIAWTILLSTSLPILTLIRVTMSFKRTLTRNRNLQKEAFSEKKVLVMSREAYSSLFINRPRMNF